jgi:hypothetical protein
MKSNPMRVAFSNAVFMSPFFMSATSHPEKFESPKSFRANESGICSRRSACNMRVVCVKVWGHVVTLNDERALFTPSSAEDIATVSRHRCSYIEDEEGMSSKSSSRIVW